MKVNYLSDRILSSKANPIFYTGSTDRKKGIDLGFALRLDSKLIVISLAEQYHLTIAKKIVQIAFPEVLCLVRKEPKLL